MGIFSVIRNAAQLFRVPDSDEPDARQTIWADLTDKRYGSTTRTNIVGAVPDTLDVSEGTFCGQAQSDGRCLSRRRARRQRG